MFTIWDGTRMASIRIYRSSCFLPAIEILDIQAKTIPLLPLRVSFLLCGEILAD